MCRVTWVLVIYAFAVALLGKESKAKDAAKTEKARLSCAVSFVIKNPSLRTWLEKPGQGFMEAHCYFPSDLDESVIFGVDQEMLEGMRKPIHFPGADWMALVGLQRNGSVWVAAGFPEGLKGKPSKERNWKLIPLGQRLKPNTWYRLRSVADFGKRRFVSFSVEGPGLKKTLDLSKHILDYPNKMPFDGRALTNYVWTINGEALGAKPGKSTCVYFDNVRAGIILAAPSGRRGAREVPLMLSGFENSVGKVESQPVKIQNGVIPLNRYREKKWYLERDHSRVRTLFAPFALGGRAVMACDATLKSLSYEEWFRLNEKR